MSDISGNKPKNFMNGWTKELEVLMAEWSDVASCYRWLHDRSEKKFYRLNMGITIPVIILSTVTGAANFAIGSLIPPEESSAKTYVSASLGAVSIFAGILTTLGNFFQYAQKSETNRVSSIAWGKFQRLLTVELAINPMDRMDAMDFLKICRQDLDRLIEQSPQVPDDVIADFEKEFKDKPNLKVPDICHGIEHTRIFDASKARLGKVAADAVLHLRYRKNILANSVMPDIRKTVEEELNTKIEKRIKELMAAPESHGDDYTRIVANLETDWRSLLLRRKLLLQTDVEPDVSGSLPPLRPEDVRINIVGEDGPIAPTPAPVSSPASVAPPLPVSSAASVVSEASHYTVTPSVSFN